MSGRAANRLVLSLYLFFVTTQAAAAETIEGVWLNQAGDGWIELRVTDGELRGVIAGSPDDPERLRPPRLDVENPDPALRTRELFGVQILYGFRMETSDRWGGGRVYDPNNGNTYRGTITLVNVNTLRLRGFIGLSLLGRTEVWTRRK